MDCSKYRSLSLKRHTWGLVERREGLSWGMELLWSRGGRQAGVAGQGGDGGHGHLLRLVGNRQLCSRRLLSTLQILHPPDSRQSFTFPHSGVYIITSVPGAAFSGGRAGRIQYPQGPQWILTRHPAPTGNPGSSGHRGNLPASGHSSAPQLSDKKQRISSFILHQPSPPEADGRADRQERRASRSPKSASSDGAASSHRWLSGLPESWGRRVSFQSFSIRPVSSRLWQIAFKLWEKFSPSGARRWTMGQIGHRLSSVLDLWSSNGH